MSISIHHGPPGSYKTSGAIMVDFTQAAKAGRVVVTNVRGLDNVETVRKVLRNFNIRKFKFEEIPETFDIINIDTTTEEGRFKMATWFHWVPNNAFIFIDEINTIYLKSLRDSDLRAFDYPNGLDSATLADRPATASQAFEMHRHNNWDICVTSPNIRKIHSIVLQSAEGAYRHKNQAMIGIKGVYQEIFHSADDDGKSKTNQLSMRQRTIKSYVFKLYKSTKTDKVRDTQAGRNLLFTPQVFGFAVIFFSLFFYLLSSDAPRAFRTVEPIPSDAEIIISSDKNAVIDNINYRSSSLVSPAIVQQLKPDYLLGYEVFYVGYIRTNLDFEHQIQLMKGGKSMTITMNWLQALGYSMTRYGDCLIELSINDKARLITCPMSSDQESTDRQTSIPEDFSI